MSEILAKVHEAFRKRVLLTSHAVDHMNLPERMISRQMVEDAIESGELVEDYPNDPRGHSCLLMGKDRSGLTLHVTCAPTPEYLLIITAYLPNLIEWEKDLRTRKRK